MITTFTWIKRQEQRLMSIASTIKDTLDPDHYFDPDIQTAIQRLEVRENTAIRYIHDYLDSMGMREERIERLLVQAGLVDVDEESASEPARS
jgi:hypothetical protein